ncbi:excinuclease ABC subunit C [Telmatobacter sp. DSM 110680]|uniref:Excinuclease ABC subunit C n=1 Tax=Telmatobacter sp. DSM 110680 TaxID=3036704 RepID=A0AAU7DLB8_9BACT
MSVELQSVPFDPAEAKAALTQLPTAPAVFALYGAEAKDEPYIGRTPNLRGRLERLLQPSAKHPRRLQLAGRVRRIAWHLTGSEFESLLTQFSLLEDVYGAKALERMHLRAPAFVRYLGGNPYPRIVVTNKPSQREADWAYGPFASRAAAERFADEALKLFLLRRCTDDLNPDPSHPGCVYSEMKMCLAPCYKGCTDERYAEESAAVQDFLATRGESKLVVLRGERDAASANLAFEDAAALHAQVQKVEAVRALAPELVQPMNRLRAVVLQASANLDEVAVFLFERGSLRGPALFSTIGMRIQNEQSGSSSLFAQPMALEPVPDETGIREQGTGSNEQEPATHGRIPRTMLEARMEAVLAKLEEDDGSTPSATVRQAHLALLKRWYYRPEVKREGEICFPEGDGHWPIKSLLRGVGRVAAKRLATAKPQ